MARFWTRTAIRRFSIIILKMFPKLFFDFFCIFELWQQFCTSGEFFIIIIFFPSQNISLATFDMLRKDVFEVYRTDAVANILTHFKFKTWPISYWLPRLPICFMSSIVRKIHCLTLVKHQKLLKTDLLDLSIPSYKTATLIQRLTAIQTFKLHLHSSEKPMKTLIFIGGRYFKVQKINVELNIISK